MSTVGLSLALHAEVAVVARALADLEDEYLLSEIDNLVIFQFPDEGINFRVTLLDTGRFVYQLTIFDRSLGAESYRKPEYIYHWDRTTALAFFRARV
jgi:hypothetical protein